MIVGVFILGVLSFVDPSHLAGFAALMPGDSGLSAGVSYLIAIALLWVMGSVSGKLLQYGLGLRSRGG